MTTIFWAAVGVVAVITAVSIALYFRLKPKKGDPDDYDTFA